MTEVRVVVNGRAERRDVEPRLLLVHLLRDELGLTGTHWGCDTSNCGACVVWLDDVPVKSCTVLAAMADGHSVRTVEGLAPPGGLDPVQRQTLPEIASRISGTDGSGLRSSRARAVMSIPGVQNPHWTPWQAMNPRCTMSSSPWRSRSSTVRTSWPPAIAASTVHDFTGSPSSHTTHAPQLLVSQPQCVPVSASSSRRKWTSRRRASISRVTSTPLTVIVTRIRPPLCGLPPGAGAA